MLNASKLKSFLQDALVAVPEIKKYFPVVSDEDMASETRDVSTNDGIFLVGVLPSFGPVAKNEDNWKYNNRLILFFVKKFSPRDEDLMDVYDETGAVVLKFHGWLLKEYSAFPKKCIFKDIDFSSFNADPVRDYNNSFGYMVTFELNT